MTTHLDFFVAISNCTSYQRILHANKLCTPLGVALPTREIALALVPLEGKAVIRQLGPHGTWFLQPFDRVPFEESVSHPLLGDA